MLKAILFDLDGTLLPMNEEEFTKGYFKLLCKKMANYGYNPDDLVKAVWAGTKEMIKNDGKNTNEEVFWKVFSTIYGEEKLKDKNLIDTFYLNEFKDTIDFCKQNIYARQIIDFIKNKGVKIILASNPVFPRDGMITRLGFIGLNEDDFDYITSYETSHYAKPNPLYFKEILEVNNLNPEEVIMFGNSEKEDCEPASSIGIKAYLVKEDDSNSKFPTVSIKDICNVIEKNVEEKN